MTRLFAALLCASAFGETLRYRAEWRGLEAGEAVVTWRDGDARLELRTKGLVAKLHRVEDVYTVKLREGYCAVSSLMRADEGKRREETSITYGAGVVSVLVRDLVRSAEVRREFPAAPCTHDVPGALRRLMSDRVEPGGAVEYQMANERKSARVRVVALRKEPVETKVGRFDAVQYEVHMLNDVLYRRKGRLLVWLSADARRLPIRIQVRMPFPLGTVTLELVAIS